MAQLSTNVAINEAMPIRSQLAVERPLLSGTSGSWRIRRHSSCSSLVAHSAAQSPRHRRSSSSSNSSICSSAVARHQRCSPRAASPRRWSEQQKNGIECGRKHSGPSSPRRTDLAPSASECSSGGYAKASWSSASSSKSCVRSPKAPAYGYQSAMCTTLPVKARWSFSTCADSGSGSDGSSRSSGSVQNVHDRHEQLGRLKDWLTHQQVLATWPVPPVATWPVPPVATHDGLPSCATSFDDRVHSSGEYGSKDPLKVSPLLDVDLDSNQTLSSSKPTTPASVRSSSASSVARSVQFDMGATAVYHYSRPPLSRRTSSLPNSARGDAKQRQVLTQPCQQRQMLTQPQQLRRGYTVSGMWD